MSENETTSALNFKMIRNAKPEGEMLGNGIFTLDLFASQFLALKGYAKLTC